MKFKKIAFIVGGVFLLSLLAYQIPYVNDRLSWRLDAGMAYFRMVIDPAGEIPTPIAGENGGQPTRIVVFTQTSIPTSLASTPTPAPSPTPLPVSISLPAPEWEKQDWNNCGPATLSLYLKYYGWSGDQFDISSQIKPERPDRNVNVEELVFFTRNNAGWLNIVFRVGGDIELLKTFLANGIPVMIEEGDTLPEPFWPNDDQWAGHYLLLTGYDDAAQTFTAQDTFKGADRQVSYEETDARWQTFNRVYILVFHPNQEETIKNILGSQWDEGFNRQDALEQAQAEIAADPENAFAWFNLGSNLVYFEDYAGAADAYNEARRIGLPQRILRYQFGPFFAYFHSNRMEDLGAIVEYALQITPTSEEALVWQGWAYYRAGDSARAIGSFQEAYWLNIYSPDAIYALDFMGASP